MTRSHHNTHRCNCTSCSCCDNNDEHSSNNDYYTQYLEHRLKQSEQKIDELQQQYNTAQVQINESTATNITLRDVNYILNNTNDEIR